MTRHRTQHDPPVTLADRLRLLNDSLQALAVRLKDAIASAVSQSVKETVQDAVRSLLGVDAEQTPQQQQPFHNDFHHSHPYQYPEDDLWHDGEAEEIAPSMSHNRRTRWQEAVRAALQTGLWWLKRPGRRPVLTTTLLALAAGSVALLAGPT